MRVSRKGLFGLAGMLVIGVGACSGVDGTVQPAEPERPQAVSLVANVGGFACGLVYHSITETYDAELAVYDVPTMTDTARVCETWTGADYQVEVTQIGSSEPATDYAEDIKTVVYQNGTTTAYDANGGFAASQPDVGPTSFELVAATDPERQASYSDPYYGVLAADDPNCAASCIAYSRADDGQAPGAHAVAEIRRPALKHLVKGRSEIGRSTEGFRQFRQITGNEETTISVDPVMELIRRHEVRNPNRRIVADLRWVKLRGKYVRERMDVVTEEITSGKSVGSRSTIRLTNVQWNDVLIK